MANKAATLKNLKVRVNKDGTLSKKSLGDVQGLIKPSVGEKIASGITVHDGVEAAGFAGLVYLNYVGIDVMGMFLERVTEFLGETVEKVGEAGNLIGEALLAVGTYVSGDATVFGNPGITAKGMSKAVVKDAADSVAASIAREIRVLELIIEVEEKRGMPEKEIQPHRDSLARLKNPDSKKQMEISQRFDHVLVIKKVAIATGMAYVEKKFLESYNYFKAVENIPFVQ